MDGLQRITGFTEGGTTDVRAHLKVNGDAIVNIVNGSRIGTGTLEILSLAELRKRGGLLALAGPSVSPNDGVTRYLHGLTPGPRLRDRGGVRT